MSNAFSLSTKNMSEMVAISKVNYDILVQLVNEVLGNGGPSGVFDTLQELNDRYPKGAKGVYLVTVNGKWYYWDGEEWAAGGVYQATQLSDGSVTDVKLEIGLREKIDSIEGIGQDVNKANADIVSLQAQLISESQRISNILAYNGDGTKDTELIDARGGATVLGDRLNGIDEQLADNETDIEQRGYNIQWSALEATDGDWTKAIQKALNTYKHVFIPGTCNVYGTIEVYNNHKLELGNGASLIKPPDATNTDPVLWINGMLASVKGAGMRNSSIKSEVPSPLGVVCIGYKGVSDTNPRAVLYNTIQDIGVVGRIDGGETTGDPSYALYLCNNELNGLASYFHTVQNVFLAQANVGLMFECFANANIINNIQLYRVGTGKRLNGAGIKFKNTNDKYPLDNMISNVFHHASADAVTLYLDGKVNLNTMHNIVSEQGGTSALFLKSTSDESSRNIISGIDNVLGGSQLATTFKKLNTLTTRSSLFLENMESKKTSTDTLVIGDSAKERKGGFSLNGLTENATYALFKVNTATARAGVYLVELSIGLKWGSDLPVMKNSANITFSIAVNGDGSFIITPIKDFSTRNLIVNPVVNGNDITFGVTIPNNGSGTSNTSVFVKYSVFGNPNLVVSEVLTPTTMTGTTTIPTHYRGTFITPVPSTPTAQGSVGDWSADANYLYVCYAANTWRRVAVATW